MRRALLALLALTAGCSSSDDDDVSHSLALGSYDVAGPLCASSGMAPQYPAASYKLALFDLDALTAHTLTVTAASAVETLSDADCTLTVTRTVYRNYANEFTLLGDRVHRFEPDGCTLAATIQEHAYPIGRAFTTALDDVATRDPEVPYQVAAPAPPGFELASIDREDYDTVWAAYGCGNPDRIVRSLSPKAP